MYRFILAVIVAFATFAAPIAAQTRSADASASVSITANLTWFKALDLDFGTHFASEGIVRTTGVQMAKWGGQTDFGERLAFHVTLPAVLSRVGGGSSTVPFACGANSAYFANSVLNIRFDPNGPGISDFIVQGVGDIYLELGRTTGDTDSDCTVNLTGRQSGTYTGTITSTVTIL